MIYVAATVVSGLSYFWKRKCPPLILTVWYLIHWMSQIYIHERREEIEKRALSSIKATWIGQDFRTVAPVLGSSFLTHSPGVEKWPHKFCSGRWQMRWSFLDACSLELSHMVLLVLLTLTFHGLWSTITLDRGSGENGPACNWAGASLGSASYLESFGASGKPTSQPNVGRHSRGERHKDGLHWLQAS